jgi:hypothetical protein
MLRIRIINPEQFKTPEKEKDIPQATWYSRMKSYDWDVNMGMDEDIKNCTVGHQLDSIELDSIYLSTRKNVQDFIDFLTNAKESFPEK